MAHEKDAGEKPAGMDPVRIFKALGDGFRLGALLLIQEHQSLCVCELTEAFEVPQPKASRHLAVLREAGLVEAERRGQWIYYSIKTGMPAWVERIVETTASNSRGLIERPAERLAAMAGRPGDRCL